MKHRVAYLLLLATGCGGGAINATADPAVALPAGQGLVAGRLSTLGCPDHRSLLDRATGGADARVVVLSRGGQLYRVDADVAADYFVAALPAGRYELEAFRVERAMGQSAWSPKDWFFEVQPGQASYIGSIRFICLVWGATVKGVEARVAVGVVSEPDAARAALAPTFSNAGTLLDASQALAQLAALPRTSGLEYELFMREDSTTGDAPSELLAVVRGLARNPKPPGAERTSSDWEYRVRSGDWEALYLLDEGARLVLVTDVRKTRTAWPRGGGAR
jgi:hypothetical protein